MHSLPDHEAGTRLAGLCSTRVEQHLGTARISIYGEFDLSCEEPFKELLGEALHSETQTLLVDLQGLEFIDSTGLQVLTELHHLAARAGVDFAVLAQEGQVMSMLRESGLAALLPVVDPSGAVPPSDSPG